MGVQIDEVVANADKNESIQRLYGCANADLWAQVKIIVDANNEADDFGVSLQVSLHC